MREAEVRARTPFLHRPCYLETQSSVPGKGGCQGARGLGLPYGTDPVVPQGWESLLATRMSPEPFFLGKPK